MKILGIHTLLRTLHFTHQSDTDQYSMNKSIPFMIPAEGADGVDNPVHFL